MSTTAVGTATDSTSSKSNEPRTEYVVLERTNEAALDVTKTRGGEAWREVKTVQSTNAERAIKEAIGNSPAVSGTYVAIPARSWKPLKVSVETVSVIKLEDA